MLQAPLHFPNSCIPYTEKNINVHTLALTYDLNLSLVLYDSHMMLVFPHCSSNFLKHVNWQWCHATAMINVTFRNKRDWNNYNIKIILLFPPKMLTLHFMFIYCWRLELWSEETRFTLYVEKLLKISLKAIISI